MHDDNDIKALLCILGGYVGGAIAGCSAAGVVSMFGGGRSGNLGSIFVSLAVGFAGMNESMRGIKYFLEEKLGWE